MSEQNKYQKNRIWQIFVAGMCGGIICCCNGVANCLGIFYSPIASDLGVGVGDVSLSVTITSIVSALLSSFIPSLLRKLGFRKSLIAGFVCTVIGITGMGFINELWALYVFAAIRGIGMALFGMAFVNYALQNWYDGSSGTVSGLVFGASGLFGAVLNPVLSSFIEGYGWHKAMIILGIIAFISGLPATLFLRIAAEDEDNNRSRIVEKTDRIKKGGNGKMILFLVASGLISLMIGLSTHIHNYAISIGIEPVTASFMLTCVMVGNILFKLLTGALSSRIGGKKTLMTAIIVVAISLVILLPSYESMFPYYLGSFLFGISYSMGTVLIAQTIRDLFPPDSFLGVFSVYQLIAGLIGAVNPAILGYVYDLTGTYRYGIFVYIAVSIAAAALFGSLKKDAASD